MLQKATSSHTQRDDFKTKRALSTVLQNKGETQKTPQTILATINNESPTTEPPPIALEWSAAEATSRGGGLYIFLLAKYVS